MLELGSYGSVRGARGNSRPYRDKHLLTSSSSLRDPGRTSVAMSFTYEDRGYLAGINNDWCHRNPDELRNFWLNAGVAFGERQIMDDVG
jgi:hypothetical protein